MTLNPRLIEVAHEAITAGIPVKVRILDFSKPGLATGTVEALTKAGYRDGDYFLEVDGFYKHGSVVLIHNAHMGYTQVFGRYNHLDNIYDGDRRPGSTLAYINHYQFKLWQDRGFELDERWIPLMVRHGILMPVTKSETTYVEA